MSLRGGVLTVKSIFLGDIAHCPVESGATFRILGMFSKVPASAEGLASCLLSASKRRRGADDVAEDEFIDGDGMLYDNTIDEVSSLVCVPIMAASCT